MYNFIGTCVDIGDEDTAVSEFFDHEATYFAQAIDEDEELHIHIDEEHFLEVTGLDQVPEGSTEFGYSINQDNRLFIYCYNSVTDIHSFYI